MKDDLKVVAIRGAITTDKNSEKEILDKTKLLLRNILDKNEIKTDQIISILFTLTKDLNAVYPAKAAREIGITKAALMCAQELPVPNSLEKCVRVMLQCYHPTKTKIKHIYLEKAKTLRSDLMEK